MDNAVKEKSRLSAIFHLCPVAHVLLLLSAALIGAHLLLRQNHELMCRISENVIAPLHQRMAAFCAVFGTVSLAEILIGIFAISILVYIIYETIGLVFQSGRLGRLYRLVIRLGATGLAVYAGYSLLWGVYYYGDDFIAASGLENGEISVEQLETVTLYFAEKLNEYSGLVPRDEDGFYTADRDEILARSNEVYRNIEKTFPCLEGPDINAKGLRFSKILSYMDFTGFFFPFTAEANLNTDFPPGLFASTVAHELAHQRGVAKEQEANFVSVLSCLDYGDAEYCYSACMLAYTHLGNALYKADYSAWHLVYSGLEENVLRDFAANRAYWQQFETPVQTVTTGVYEGFLQSYDQTLGMKSYGACVDLLVNYYYAEAAEYYGLK
ncbi:MAG: DUF3810 domain-containing protein [Oscillospiraceae bacterium]|nr:DUF3810 domain-containing protein [Oscillospiraceae bacterium]